MIYKNLGELLERTECRYTLVMEVAKRARQLVDGAEPQLDSYMESGNNVTLAVEEIYLDKIAFEGIPDREGGRE